MKLPRILRYGLIELGRNFAFYYEFPSVTRGDTWLDWERRGDALFLWAGRLHIVADLPWLRRTINADPSSAS